MSTTTPVAPVRSRRRSSRRRTIMIGLALLAVAALVVAAIFAKPALISALRPGETMEIAFSRDYKIEQYGTGVKIGGTPVGEVSSIGDYDEDSGIVVGLKLDTGTLEMLGTAPSAEIRPTTVLGGKYYIALYPGGDRGTFTGERIPVGRSSVPVELDSVLAAVPPTAQEGLRGMTERMDSTLQAGAGDSLQNVLQDAPDVLAPTGVTVDALRGGRPDTDLLATVSNLNRTADVLTATPGRLESMVDGLARTSKVLGDNASPVTDAVSRLPEALRATTVGINDFSSAFDKIIAYAGDLRPSVQQLDPLLRDLDPALIELRPVLADLRPLMADAAPLVEQLTPTVEQGTSVLRDLNGPVLDRVNGPIVDTIMNEWHGDAPKYTDGGGDGNRFYEELGYMFGKFANSTQYFDESAHLLGFQPGVGSTSLEGTGPVAQQAQTALTEIFGLPNEPGDPPLQIPPAGGIPLAGERAGANGQVAPSGGNR